MKHQIIPCCPLIGALLFILASCQLTPSKVDYATTTEETLPQTHMTEECALDNGITLFVDAGIEAVSSRLPVGEYEPINISIDLVKKVYAALCGNRQPYQYTETAEELMNYALYELEQAKYAEPLIDKSRYQEEMAFIDHVLEAVATAPSTQREACLDDIFTYPDTLVEVNTGKTHQAVFKALDEERRAFTYDNINRRLNKNVPQNGGLRISADDALMMAEKVLAAIGLQEDFSLISVDTQPLECSIWSPYFSNETKDRAYHLIFLRKVNGLPQLDSDRILSGVHSDYDLDFLQEYIEMLIDDSGIISFVWMEPGEIVVKSEAAVIISFEDAFTQMKGSIPYSV